MVGGRGVGKAYHPEKKRCRRAGVEPVCRLVRITLMAENGILFRSHPLD